MSCIFFQTLKGRLPKYRGTMNQSSRRRLWIRLWDLDSGRTFRIRTAVTLPSEAERPETPADHSPFTSWLETPAEQTHHLSSRLNQSSINQSMIDLKFRPLESRRHWLSSSPPCLDCVWKSWDVSVHLLQLLLHHLLLLLLFLSQCSDCSFFFMSEKLMKLLKLLFNLTLCVLSLRLKSNHIHFNHLHQHTSTHHFIQIQEKLRHPTYNRSRSRLLLVIYNNNNLKSIILNITNLNRV